MKVAFFFDTVLLKNKKNDFFGMTLVYDFFKERYLTIFDEMIISTRCKNIENEEGDIKGYRKTNGEKVEVLPIENYKNIPDAVLKNRLIKKEIDEIVKKVDSVIIRMPSILGMFACQSAEKYNKKYLIEMVACPWDGYLNHARLGGKVIAPVITLLTKKYVKNSPKVLYVTEKFLQRRYPTRGEQIDCSDVLLNENSEEILKNRIDKLNKMDFNKKIKLCTVASVQLKYKGQEYVIRALHDLKMKGYNFEYCLAGGGDNHRLKELTNKLNMENEIRFLGSLPHDEIFNLLDSIDIYIQPSLQEGLPRAVIEAMSRACPIIGSDAGGIPELIDKEYIFKRRNVNEIARILSNIEKDKLEQACINNFNNSKKFNKEILGVKRKKFYSDLLN